ncbi:phosphatase PAP2 family protein [Archangium lansingense]|uniref:Phosphatase PAP2 family protein n=1 Tax=Archangium lansingense TaxID=2995310 RepID=A0ABT3ZWM2_9BACT|nr:phosphatase PAP2 family protein [Archangium lansinium]MCY1073771.1 phosphatase PAP2 family protein [Archangium lansinium]
MQLAPRELWVRFHGKLGADGIGLLATLLTLAAVGLGFIGLSDEVREQETQHFDERVLLSLRRADNPEEPRGPRWLAEAARDVTALGSVSVLTLVVCAVAGFLVLVRRWRSLALVVGSTVGGALVNTLLKSLFARPRPTVVPHLTHVLTESFPSGHAMLSAIVYLTLGALLAQLVERRWLRAYLVGVALSLTLLVGLTRVYLGVHYPTDVLGGWMAGLAWALLTALLARAVKRRSPGLREESRGETAPS